MLENVQYATWAELFKIHARSHRVIDHIIPPQDGKQKAPPMEEETKLWLTLDVTVLQWIYATISHDLLHTILEPAPRQWRLGIGYMIYSKITNTLVSLHLSMISLHFQPNGIL